MNFLVCPVRPNEESESSLECMPCGDDEDGWEDVNDSHVVSENWGREAQQCDFVDTDDNVTVQQFATMPGPLQPSKAQVEAHNLTHLPYRSWCPHCVAARRQNSPHSSVKPTGARTVPLLVADYCFVKDHIDDATTTVFVAKLYPSNLILSTVADEKGASDAMVARLAQFIKETGYSHVAYRSDQEPAIRSLFEAAFTLAVRNGQVLQFTPEASSVGESQSNGKAESAVRAVEDKLRTYKSALETRIGQRVPNNSPIFTGWSNMYVQFTTGSYAMQMGVLHLKLYMGKGGVVRWQNLERPYFILCQNIYALN